MKRYSSVVFLVCSLISWNAFAWPGMALSPLHVDGRYLKDNCGNNILLHGVALTPSPWFNGCQYGFGSSYCTWDNYNVQGALAYNKAVMDRLTNTSDGWHLNYIRLHIDPYWTNEPGAPIPENDISRFKYDRLVRYTDEVIIPLINYARDRGLYVILRPPGVCPERIAVNDAYHNYLKTIWTFLSQHRGLKNVDHVMFELANEPVQILGTNGAWGTTSNEHFAALKNFFQPLVDIIRNNGAGNICWIPGTGWQSHYQGYVNHPITGGNIGYAVHIYPGYWGGIRNYQAFQQGWNTNVKPIADIAPIAITETDWAPEGYGAFGVATTGTALGDGFGANLKYIADQSGNVSWNVLSPDNLLHRGDVNAGTAYNNDWEACAAPVKQWFGAYAASNIPDISCVDGNLYQIRARSTDGLGSINLLINNEVISTFTLTSSMADYKVASEASGTISVQHDNNEVGRDVQIDYVTVNGSRREAEDQKNNTGVLQRGSCGGAYSEWLHCNGSIEFGTTTGSDVVTTIDDSNEQAVLFTPYPNPSDNGNFIICSPGGFAENYNLVILTVTGQQVFEQQLCCEDQYMIRTDLPSGSYVFHMMGENFRSIKHIVIK